MKVMEVGLVEKFENHPVTLILLRLVDRTIGTYRGCNQRKFCRLAARESALGGMIFEFFNRPNLIQAIVELRRFEEASDS